MSALARQETVRALVLGLGNILQGDDGIGVHALERLRGRHDLPSEVKLLDGGTIGMALLPHLEGVTHLLVLDAVHSDRPPGTTVRLVDDEIPVAHTSVSSMHDAGLAELLAAAALQGLSLRRTALLGVEPECVECGVGLSPLVAGSLDSLVALAVRELLSWGFDVTGAEGNG